MDSFKMIHLFLVKGVSLKGLIELTLGPFTQITQLPFEFNIGKYGWNMYDLGTW